MQQTPSWAEDPDEADSVGVDLIDTAIGLATMTPRLETAAQDAIHDKWIALLGVGASPGAADRLTSSLFASDDLEEWADDAIAALVPWFSTSYDFTSGATTATARIMVTGLASDSMRKEVLNPLASIVQHGGTHRQRALASTAKLPWAAQVLSDVNANFARYIDEFTSTDFWTLIDLQLLRDQVAEEFIACIDRLVADDGPDSETIARAAALSHHLELDNAVTIALESGLTEAIEIIAQRRGELATEAASRKWAAYLEQATSTSVTTASRTALANAFAVSDPELYADTVRGVLDDTVDSGSTKHATKWRFITLPLGTATRRGIKAALQPLLLGSARDAIAASVVLHATRADPEFDQLISHDVETALEHWIGDEPEANVAAAIAGAVRGSKVTASRALSLRKRKPRIPARAAAYQAALDALHR